MENIDKVTDLRALYKAYKRASRGKQNKAASKRFALNPLEGLCRLMWSLRDQTYTVDGYSEFSVERPVHRDVKACSFKDKIVLSSLCKNVLWDQIGPHLIKDNYASRVGLGTHVALDYLEKRLRAFYINHGTNGYVLRMDARKYFYHLSHDAIKAELKKLGFDEWTLWLCGAILDSSHNSLERGYVTTDEKGRPHVVLCDMDGMPELEIGSPIGNETSQAFAVLYLNDIDHYIKDQCGIKDYGRYMDDSWIIHHDRAYLEQLKSELEKRYADKGLELNQKTQISPLKNGVPFLGMHFYLTDTGKVIKQLRPKNVKYQRVHIRENAEAVAEGYMTEDNYWKRFEAMDNHNSYADANKLRRQLRKYAEEALNNAYNKQQRKLGEVGENVDDSSRSPH